jgi:hypothetical protein
MRVWPFPHRRAAAYELSEFFDPVVSDWMGAGPQWNSGVIYGESNGKRGLFTENWGYEEVPDESLVSFTFDLSKPLEPQISEVKNELEIMQANSELTDLERVELAYGHRFAGTKETPINELFQKLKGKKRAPKLHRDKWPSYLRVLDARAAKASWSEITVVFFTDGILGRRAAPEGGYRAPPPQSARNLWLQAKALRF